MLSLRKLFYPETSEEVRLIAWATSVRWFGWGLAEALLPVFLFSFAHTYAETGLLRSVYGIMFLLSLPVVAWFADNVQSKKLMLAALWLYPLIALSYFFAGVWGAVVFIVLARCINGVAYALDSVGRSTYIRTFSKNNGIATAFGFIESLANFWWIIAIFVSIILIKFLPVHYLFLFIVPTSLIAMLFVRRISNKKANVDEIVRTRLSFFASYKDFFTTIASWNSKVREFAGAYFTLSVIATICEFFIPIYAFNQGEALWKVMLLMAFTALPSLFSSPLGVFADKYDRKAISLAGSGLVILLLALAFVSPFAIRLILVFCIGICIELGTLAIHKGVTVFVPKDKLGSLSGAFQGIGQISEIAGPILLGITIDVFSMRSTLIGLSCVLLLFTFRYMSRNNLNLVARNN